MSSFCIYVPLSSYNLRHFLLDLDLTAQTSLSDGSPPLQCTTVNAGESSPPFFFLHPSSSSLRRQATSTFLSTADGRAGDMAPPLLPRACSLCCSNRRRNRRHALSDRRCIYPAASHGRNSLIQSPHLDRTAHPNARSLPDACPGHHRTPSGSPTRSPCDVVRSALSAWPRPRRSLSLLSPSQAMERSHA
jgi:hypothetical protein